MTPSKPGGAAPPTRISYLPLSRKPSGQHSPELYLLFVRERGWPYERWVRQTLLTQLCSD